VQSQEALQALLAMAASLNSSSTQNIKSNTSWPSKHLQEEVGNLELGVEKLLESLQK
ncbi:14270_t:CDS:2, partial [Dentiscutata heterogama]